MSEGANLCGRSCDYAEERVLHAVLEYGGPQEIFEV